MVKELSGKVALVTGASRGIGRAVALALGEAGASVAVGYVSSSDKARAVVAELEQLDVRAEAFRAELGDAAAVSQLVRDVHARFGRLDILVNNAGVGITPATIGQTTSWEAGDHLYAINQMGVIAAIRAAAPLMSDNGRIITIGSCMAARAGFAGAADYVASKAAVAGYSKAAARDLGARGITVNVVQAGPTDTDMNPQDGPYASFTTPLMALGRYASADEIARPVVFLASPGASFITGATIDVDGGMNA